MKIIQTILSASAISLLYFGMSTPLRAQDLNPRGIYLYRAHEWYKDDRLIDVVEYRAIETAKDGKILTVDTGKWNGPSPALAVDYVPYPDIDSLQSIQSASDLEPIKKEIQLLIAKWQRFPQTGPFLRSYVKALQKEVDQFNSGKLKAYGKWLSKDDFQKQIKWEKEQSEIRRKTEEQRLMDEQKAEKEAKAQAQQLEAQQHEEQKHLVETKRQAEADNEPTHIASIGKFGGWTMNSNGHTWNAAPESAKQSLCRRLAAKSRHENSAAYFYDALSSFYNSTDPNILQTSLDDITRLTEAASTSLPLNQRDY